MGGTNEKKAFSHAALQGGMDGHGAAVMDLYVHF